MSTQDLDFSLDDLDEEPSPKALVTVTAPAEQDMPKAVPTPLAAKAVDPRAVQKTVPTVSTTLPAKKIAQPVATANSSRPLASTKKIAGKCLNPGPFATGLEYELSKLRPSQLPESMTGLRAKRKDTAISTRTSAPPAKKHCVSDLHTAVPMQSMAASGSKGSFEEFIMSTQEAASFFDDDDDFNFGSPPIAV